MVNLFPINNKIGAAIVALERVAAPAIARTIRADLV